MSAMPTSKLTARDYLAIERRAKFMECSVELLRERIEKHPCKVFCYPCFVTAQHGD